MHETDGNEMEPARKSGPENPPALRWTVRSIVGRILLYCGFLLIAIVSLGAYEHFKLHGERTQALVSLLSFICGADAFHLRNAYVFGAHLIGLIPRIAASVQLFQLTH